MKTRALLLSAAIASCSLSGQVFAQGTAPSDASVTQTARNQIDLRSFIAGTNLPLTLVLKNLTSEFRRVVVRSQGDSFSNYIQMMGGSAGLELGVYYTKGDTVSLGSETYLVAYRPQIEVDPQILQNIGRREMPVITKPAPDTELALSLLNLRTCGSLNDVRPFNRNTDMQTPQDVWQASNRALENLGRAVLNSVRFQRGGTFPSLSITMTPAMRNSFQLYTQGAYFWRNPATREYYAANSSLSNVKLQRITNTKYLPMFYEAKDAENKTRAVVFVDGHVERVPAERWKRLATVKPVFRQRQDPSAVMNTVKASLAGNGSLKGSKIQVEVFGNGAVYLRGTVTSPDQKRIAEQVTKRHVVDYRVENLLVVQKTGSGHKRVR